MDELDQLLAEAMAEVGITPAPQLDPEHYAHNQFGWFSQTPFAEEPNWSPHPSGLTLDQINQFLADPSIGLPAPTVSPWATDSLPIDNYQIDQNDPAMQEMTPQEVSMAVDGITGHITDYLANNYGIQFDPTNLSTNYVSKWDTKLEFQRMWQQLKSQDDYIKMLTGGEDQMLNTFLGALDWAQGLLYRPKTIGTYQHVEGVGDMLEYAGGAFGNALPTMLQSMASGAGGMGLGAAIGAGVGAAAAPFTAGASIPAGAAIGGKIGAAGGATAGSFGPNAALWYFDELAQGHNEPTASAVVGGISAPLDALVPGSLGYVFGKTVSAIAKKFGKKELAQELTKRSMAGHVARYGAGAAATEGVTEATQEAVQLAASKWVANRRDGVPVEWTAMDRQVLIDAGLAGMIAGGGMGAAGGSLNYARDRMARRKGGPEGTGGEDPAAAGQGDGGPPSGSPPPAGGGPTAQITPPQTVEQAAEQVLQQAEQEVTGQPITQNQYQTNVAGLDPAAAAEVKQTIDNVMQTADERKQGIQQPQQPAPPQYTPGQRVKWSAYEDTGEGEIVSSEDGVTHIRADSGQMVEIHADDTSASIEPVQVPQQTAEPSPPPDGTVAQPDATQTQETPSGGLQQPTGQETPAETQNTPSGEGTLDLPTGQQPQPTTGGPLESGQAPDAPHVPSMPQGRPTGARDPNAPTATSDDGVEFAVGDTIEFQQVHMDYPETGQISGIREDGVATVEMPSGQTFEVDIKGGNAHPAEPDSDMVRKPQAQPPADDQPTVGGALGADTEPAGPLDVKPTEPPPTQTETPSEAPKTKDQPKPRPVDPIDRLRVEARPVHQLLYEPSEDNLLARLEQSQRDQAISDEDLDMAVLHYHVLRAQPDLSDADGNVQMDLAARVRYRDELGVEQRKSLVTLFDYLHWYLGKERDVLYTAIQNGQGAEVSWMGETHTISDSHALELILAIRRYQHHLVQQQRRSLDWARRTSLKTGGFGNALTRVPNHILLLVQSAGAQIPGLAEELHRRNIVGVPPSPPSRLLDDRVTIKDDGDLPFFQNYYDQLSVADDRELARNEPAGAAFKPEMPQKKPAPHVPTYNQDSADIPTGNWGFDLAPGEVLPMMDLQPALRLVNADEIKKALKGKRATDAEQQAAQERAADVTRHHDYPEDGPIVLWLPLRSTVDPLPRQRFVSTGEGFSPDDDLDALEEVDAGPDPHLRRNFFGVPMPLADDPDIRRGFEEATWASGDTVFDPNTGRTRRSNIAKNRDLQDRIDNYSERLEETAPTTEDAHRIQEMGNAWWAESNDPDVVERWERIIPKVSSSYRGFPVHIHRFEKIERGENGRWTLIARGQGDQTFRFHSNDEGHFLMVTKPKSPNLDVENADPYPNSHPYAQRMRAADDYELGVHERRQWKWSQPREHDRIQAENRAMEHMAGQEGALKKERIGEAGYAYDWLPMMTLKQEQATARAEMQERTEQRKDDYEGTKGRFHKDVYVGETIVYPMTPNAGADMTTGVVIRKGKKQTAGNLMAHLTKKQRERVLSGTKQGQRMAEQRGVSMGEGEPTGKRGNRAWDRQEELSATRYVTVVNLDTGRRHIVFADYNLRFHVFEAGAEIELDTEGLPVIAESEFGSPEAAQVYQEDRRHDVDAEVVEPLSVGDRVALEDSLGPEDRQALAKRTERLMHIPDDDLSYALQRHLMHPDLRRPPAYDRLLRESYLNEIQRRDTARVELLDGSKARWFSPENMPAGNRVWVFSIANAQYGGNGTPMLRDGDRVQHSPRIGKVLGAGTGGRLWVRLEEPLFMPSGASVSEVLITPDFDDHYYEPGADYEMDAVRAPKGGRQKPKAEPKKTAQPKPRVSIAETIREQAKLREQEAEGGERTPSPDTTAEEDTETTEDSGQKSIAEIIREQAKLREQKAKPKTQPAPKKPKKKPKRTKKPVEGKPPRITKDTVEDIDAKTAESRRKLQEAGMDTSSSGRMAEVIKQIQAQKQEANRVDERQEEAAPEPEQTNDPLMPEYERQSAQWQTVSEAKKAGWLKDGTEIWIFRKGSSRNPARWYRDTFMAKADRRSYINAKVMPFTETDARNEEMEDARIKQREAIHGKARTAQNMMTKTLVRTYADQTQERVADLAPPRPDTRRYMAISLDEETNPQAAFDASQDDTFTEEDYALMKPVFDDMWQEAQQKGWDTVHFVNTVLDIVFPMGPMAVRMFERFGVELDQQQQKGQDDDPTDTDTAVEDQRPDRPDTDPTHGAAGSPAAPGGTPAGARPGASDEGSDPAGAGGGRAGGQRGGRDGRPAGPRGGGGQNIVGEKTVRAQERAADRDRFAANHRFSDEDVTRNLDANRIGRRVRNNVEALRTLAYLERTQAYPAEDQRQALASYSGWAGLEPYVWELYNHLTKEVKGKRVPVPYGEDRNKDIRPVQIEDLDLNDLRTDLSLPANSSDDQVAEEWHNILVELFELVKYDEITTLYPFIAKGKGMSAADYEQRYANATSTPLPVAERMWQLLQAAGFTQGDVLDFGFGVGSIIGTQPTEIREFSRVLGIDQDPIAARISRKLYPQALVQESRIGQRIPPMPANSVSATVVDLDQQLGAIGEADYGAVEGNRLVQVVQAVQPGGVAVVLANTGYMDANSSDARREIAGLAHLVGIIRFNVNLYGNGNAQRDLLVFRRRRAGDRFTSPNDPDQEVQRAPWAIPPELWAEPKRKFELQSLTQGEKKGGRKTPKTKRQQVVLSSSVPALFDMAEASHAAGRSEIVYRDATQLAVKEKGHYVGENQDMIRQEVRWAQNEEKLKHQAEHGDPDTKKAARKQLAEREVERARMYGPEITFPHYQLIRRIETPTDGLPVHNNSFTPWNRGEVQSKRREYDSKYGGQQASELHVSTAIQSVQDHLEGVRVNGEHLHQASGRERKRGFATFDPDRLAPHEFSLIIEKQTNRHVLNQMDAHGNPLLTMDEKTGRVQGQLSLPENIRDMAKGFVLLKQKINTILQLESEGKPVSDDLRQEARREYDQFTIQHGNFWSRELMTEEKDLDKASDRRKVVEELVKEWADARSDDRMYDTGSFSLDELVEEIQTEQKEQRASGMDETSEHMTKTLTNKAATKRYMEAMQEHDRRRTLGETDEDWMWGDFDIDSATYLEYYRYPVLETMYMDPSFRRIAALVEDVVYDNSGDHTKDRFVPGKIFSEPIMLPEETAVPDELHAALEYHAVVLGGPIHMADLAQHVGLTVDEAVQQLGDKVFRVPGAHELYQTREMYLTGDVVGKLNEARTWAADDPQFERNVTALEAALPAPMPLSSINHRLSAPWVQPHHIRLFLSNFYNIPADVVDTSFVIIHHQIEELLDSYQVEWRGKDKAAERNLPSDALRLDAEVRIDKDGPKEPRTVLTTEKLLHHALNGTYPTIRSWEPDPMRDGEITKRVAEDVSAAARAVIDDLQLSFNEWLHNIERDTTTDPLEVEAAAEISEAMNEHVNRFVGRDDAFWQRLGDKMSIPGMRVGFQPRGYQRAVAARMLHQPTYLGHAVGAGKTMSMAIATMKARQLGLVDKPLLVVHPATLEGFATEFQQNFPTARLLVGTSDIFSGKEKRRTFEWQASQGDWDAIIVDHNALKNHMNISTDALYAVQTPVSQSIASYPHPIMKQKGAGNRIKRWRSRSREIYRSHGNQLLLDTMGVDQMIVDEAHLFRKLDIFTEQTNMRGVVTQGSEMSARIYTIMGHLNRVNPIIPLHLASGTPVTNTLGEVYTIARYMARDRMRDMGILNFDGWVRSFSGVAVNYEWKSGQLVPRTSLRHIRNVSHINQFHNSFMDYRALDTVMSMIEAETGRSIEYESHTAPTPRNERQKYHQYVAIKRERATRSKYARKGRVLGSDRFVGGMAGDIILTILQDNATSAVDARLVEPKAPAERTKLSDMIDNIARLYEEEGEITFTDLDGEKVVSRPVQLVFADTAKHGTRRNPSFKMHQHIRRELIKQGIPEDRIAIYDDHKRNLVKKAALFHQVNTGRISVLIGHTKEMGVGVNVQRLLKHMHFLDPQDLPADQEQRIGRGYRFGNLNPRVHGWNYVTEDSHDAVKLANQQLKGVTTKGLLDNRYGSGQATIAGNTIEQDLQSEVDPILSDSQSDDRVPRQSKLQAQVRELSIAQQRGLETQNNTREQMIRDEQDRDTLQQTIPFMDARLHGMPLLRGRVWEGNSDNVQGQEETRAQQHKERLQQAAREDGLPVKDDELPAMDNAHGTVSASSPQLPGDGYTSMRDLSQDIIDYVKEWHSKKMTVEGDPDRIEVTFKVGEHERTSVLILARERFGDTLQWNITVRANHPDGYDGVAGSDTAKYPTIPPSFKSLAKDFFFQSRAEFDFAYQQKVREMPLGLEFEDTKTWDVKGTEIVRAMMDAHDQRQDQRVFLQAGARLLKDRLTRLQQQLKDSAWTDEKAAKLAKVSDELKEVTRSLVENPPKLVLAEDMIQMDQQAAERWVAERGDPTDVNGPLTRADDRSPDQSPTAGKRMLDLRTGQRTARYVMQERFITDHAQPAVPAEKDEAGNEVQPAIPARPDETQDFEEVATAYVQLVHEGELEETNAEGKHVRWIIEPVPGKHIHTALVVGVKAEPMMVQMQTDMTTGEQQLINDNGIMPGQALDDSGFVYERRRQRPKKRPPQTDEGIQMAASLAEGAMQWPRGELSVVAFHHLKNLLDAMAAAMLPEHTKVILERSDEYVASYDGDLDLIRIATRGLNSVGKLEHRFHHEAVHALLQRLPPSAQRLLRRMAREQWIDQYNIRRHYPDLWQAALEEEAIAEAFAHWMKNDGTKESAPSGTQRVFEMIKDFFEKLANLFRRMGWQTANDVFWAMSRGDYNGRNPNRDGRTRQMARGLDEENDAPHPRDTDPADRRQKPYGPDDLLMDGVDLDDVLGEDPHAEDARSFSEKLDEYTHSFWRSRRGERKTGQDERERDQDRGAQTAGYTKVGRDTSEIRSESGRGRVEITDDQRDAKGVGLSGYVTLPQWTFRDYPDLHGVVELGARAQQDFVALEAQWQKNLDHIINGQAFPHIVKRWRNKGNGAAAAALAADMKPLTDAERAAANHVMLQYDAVGLEPELDELLTLELNHRQAAFILETRRLLERIGSKVEQHERDMLKRKRSYVNFLYRDMATIVSRYGLGGVDIESGAQFVQLLRAENHWHDQLMRLQHDPNADEEAILAAEKRLYGERLILEDTGQEVHVPGLKQRIEDVVREMELLAEDGGPREEHAARALNKMLVIARETSKQIRSGAFVRRRQGYVPHVFMGRWQVFMWDGSTMDPETQQPQWIGVSKADTGFFINQHQAVHYATRLMRQHPNHQFRVTPLRVQAPDMKGDPLSIHTYVQLMRRIADAIGDPVRQQVPYLSAMSHEQLQQLAPEIEELLESETDPTARVNKQRALITKMFRTHARRMSLGAKMHRKGHPGYNRAVEHVLSLHLQNVAKYIMLDQVKYSAVTAMQKRQWNPEWREKGEPEVARAFREWLHDRMDRTQPFEDSLTQWMHSPLSKHLSRPLNFGAKAGLLMGVLSGGAGLAMSGGSLAVGGIAALMAGSVYGAFGAHAAAHTPEQYAQRRTAANMAKVVAHAKLGLFFNVAASIVNLSQLALNTMPLVDLKHVAAGMRDYAAAVSRSDMRKFHDLRKSGIPFESGYDETLFHSTLNRNVVEKISMWNFHQAETWNRGVTYFAAKRQARAQHPDWTAQRVKDYAMGMVRKTQHDYSNASRPPILRWSNLPARAATQFLNFMIQQTGFWLGLARDDKKAFGKAMLYLFIITGVTGMPFAALFGALVSAVADDYDPMEDVEEWLLAQIASGDMTTATAAWWALAGFPAALFGMDLSQRIGAGRHFVPQSPVGPLMNTVAKAAGQVHQESDFQQIMRTVSPGLGNPMWAIEAAATGSVPAPAGDTLYHDPNVGELAKMATGFMPTRTSYAYRVRSLIYEEKARRTMDRKRLGNMMERAFRKGEPLDREAIIDAVIEHRLSNPEGSIQDAMKRVLMPEWNSMRGLDRRDYPRYLKLQPTR